MKNSSLCPCGSNKNFGECCEPLIKGLRNADSAEELMCSRYTAYTLQNIDYILATTHKSKTAEMNVEEIKEWSRSTEWNKLEIVSLPKPNQVEFIAYYRDGTELKRHHELATFKKDGEKWFFLDAEFPKPTTYVNRETKVGRNDPCPCGSKKKYKKCCGKK
jgi:SEC-C motif-containing protein